MSFKADNKAYETWLRSQCDVVEDDLRTKHRRMKESPFIFLRATFFRWAKRIETVCPQFADAPAVLAVGDTHVENFGTWRDHEGRLVWGVNDFDEAATLPYAYDLVRLAASVRLSQQLQGNNREAAEAILKGYRKGLVKPRPTLLDEQETWMRRYVVVSDKKRPDFWKDIEEHPKAIPPPEVVDGFKRHLPCGADISHMFSWTRGGGSLGRPRFVAVARWRGGRVVREAKALVPSAWDWAHGQDGDIRFLDLARGRFRSWDPFIDVHARFLLRRIAADSRKIELDDDHPMRLRLNLLRAMGFDLGAIHAADRSAVDAVIADLRGRPDDWLYDAAKTAAAAVEEDFNAWRR